MSKMVQIRDVPDSVHGTLKARAAERPSMREWLQQTRRTKPISSRLTAAQAIRELRDSK
jgi:plasmid stability protein